MEIPDKHLIFPVLLIALFFLAVPSAARGDGHLHKLKHIIIVMQENHSFDNYFGALAYDPQSPYHNGNGACSATDHRCVDGLSCAVNAGSLACSNVNLDDDATLVAAYHDPRLCVIPDLDHEWGGSHFEANFAAPNDSLAECLNDGFVLQNDLTLQPDSLTGESAGLPPDDDTMGFYTQDDLPFYYYLAEHFAIDDRYFAPVLGPTAPNRFYLMAATSFGHISGAEQVIITSLGPPPTTQPYQPINGAIFDLLDRYGVSWTDYYSDVPEIISFRTQAQVAVQGKLISQFYIDAAAGTLPRVSFVESAGGENPFLPMPESDEHPPTDPRRGQAFASQVVNAVRNRPNWKDSIIFITYDEHGGFYDHAASPRASKPDTIGPGQCADLSYPPASEQLGGGVNCTDSQSIAQALCPSATPNQSFPAGCAAFNQYGFRVPFTAVSPFSKPGYVSHTVADHTSILALIEKRFLPAPQPGRQTFLTRLDHRAATLQDMFDFDNSPSADTPVPTASLPTQDCVH
jgi:phospholipase C